MKPSLRPVLWLALVAGMVLVSAGDPVSQAQPELSKGAEGTFHLDWEGEAGRTYFTEYSFDLETWHYAPFLDFGDGEHSRGVDSDADKMFLRLNFVDDPDITTLDEAMAADFDEDGLLNLFEVMNGYNPLLADTNGDGTPDGDMDADADGSLNTSEQASGRDPAVKDHPATGLVVVAAE